MGTKLAATTVEWMTGILDQSKFIHHLVYRLLPSSSTSFLPLHHLSFLSFTSSSSLSSSASSPTSSYRFFLFSFTFFILNSNSNRFHLHASPLPFLRQPRGPCQFRVSRGSRHRGSSQNFDANHGFSRRDGLQLSRAQGPE